MIELLPLIAGSGLFRNVAGWAERSFADGKVNAYEWKQLASTVIRVGVLAVSAHLGLNLELADSGALAVGLDLLLSRLKK